MPTAVGRTAGSHEVSNTGAATYTIPIWAPPGIRGIEPYLTLTYSSAAADTLLGPGWNLSGLSAIGRCARTWVQDGAPGGVALSFADKFCLDGNRLRLTAGTYGAAGSTYQTEIETFSKVTAQGVAGNGPLWFEVKGKDGFTYEYGRTGDARVFAVGSATPYLWALNKVSDRNGNYLVVSYVQTQGSFRPALIQYAFSPTYHYQVSFAYITRPTGTNLSSYIGGSQVQQQMLLSQISIQSDGALVRQYNLDYATSPTTRRARLSAVQECTVNDCLLPTTIAYQNGQAGVVAVTTSAGTGATSGSVNTLDMNGDGRMDLVYSTVSGATHTWWVRLATSTGFGAALATGVVTTILDRVMFDDFDANGSVDLLTTSGGAWSLSRWNGSGFSLSSTGTPVDLSTSLAGSADINGDGLPDLVYYRTDLKGVYTRLNTATSGVVTFASTATRAYSPPQPLVALWGNNSIPASAIRHMDFNGDGREDVIVLYRNGPPVQLPLVAQLFSQGSTFTQGETYTDWSQAPVPVAWNDDACTDLVASGVVRVSGCTNTPAFSLGVGATNIAADWDGDGRTDALSDSGGTLFLYRSTGDGVAAAVSTGLPTGNGSWQAFDHNGDGLADLAFTNAAAGNAVTFGLHGGDLPDLASSITDGFGLNASFSYASIAAWSSCYARDSGSPAFPASAFVGPMYVVCNLSASNGIGGTYQVSNSYYNSNVHLQGRGWLGFERRYVIDNRDGIVHMESYSQSFPHIGLAQYMLARQSDWTTKIRELTHTPATLVFGTGYEARIFPYFSASSEDSYEAGGSLNGQLIRRTTTATTLDAFGNPTAVTVSVTDRSASSPWNGETFTTRTDNTITNDTGNWCLGLPTQTSVTSTLPDGTSQARTTAMAVDYAYCRMTQQVIEPSSSTLRTTTTYGFDACGNVSSTSIVGRNPNGTDMPARTTTANYGPRCQFPESTTNPLGQTWQRTFRYDLGLVSSESDPNGLVISSFYDGYGRKTQERRPDGTSTTWSFWSCDSTNNYCGVPDLRWAFAQTELDNASALITYKYVYHDGLNRVRYDERLNLAGGLTYFTTGYDALGRKSLEYVPVSTGRWHYHVVTYDLLNRPVNDALYDASGTFDRDTRIAYEGRKTAVADAKGNITTRYSDVRGNLRRVVDPAPGGTTQYTWDHFGNLLSAIDPIGAASSATYDIRGFKRTSFDSDAGTWSYDTNSLGELVSQTDANGRNTTLIYDALGRLTSRTEFEGTSSWTWGNSAAAKNIGRLQSLSGPGYSESYAYDGFGRPDSITYNADTSYQVNFGYHAVTGLIDNITYPVSTAGYRLRTQYVYTNGILSQVRDFNTPATVWWRLIAEDARGNPIDEQLGNGVHAMSSFDELTGHLNWRTSGNNAQYNNHQNVSFAWDKNENLEQRVDVN
ncbi:MAG TPA: FG-GAP-like repeat-containing protein, partial [Steroidobacteraceae bacterium]|nr:FG-GAP-like repeat-containing protein [Steroidobacteraceae bacterium]